MAYTAGSAISSDPANAVTNRTPREAYQGIKIHCTKESCQRMFDSLEEMKQHKKYDPEHFYCKRCDFDAEDWEDLTNHKVENMAPYIEGAAGRVKKFDDDLKHIVCEFCGEDFKSFGGRKKHRQQSHPADQDITCPGCQGKFIRASHLIEHLEKSHCLAIPAHVFHAEIQRKYIVKQIMQAPDKAFQPPKTLCGKPSTYSVSTYSVTDGGETFDQDTGGVSLMDQRDEAQLGGHKPMEAEKSLIDLHAQQNNQTWPRISPQSPESLAESMRSMSIGPRSTPADRKRFAEVGAQRGAQTPRSAAADQKRFAEVPQRRAQAPRKGENVHTESYPGLSSPSAASMYEDDAASATTAKTASAMGGTSAWSGNQTSRALFPNAKVTPKARVKAGDWAGILAQKEEEAESNTGVDVLKTAWWDPSSEDYDITRFQHPVYEAFFCPFPACEDAMFGNSFDTQSDIEGHIKYCHTRTKYRCEGCFKHFKGPASLVAHVESTRRCGIRSSENFAKFLDEVTGGFLKSKYLGEPKIYRKETAVVKKGQPTGGIASTKFVAKDTHIW